MPQISHIHIGDEEVDFEKLTIKVVQDAARDIIRRLDPEHIRTWPQLLLILKSATEDVENRASFSAEKRV